MLNMKLIPRKNTPSSKNNRRGLYNVEEKGSLTRGQRAASSETIISSSWMPIFPARVTKRLRYSDSFVLTITTGAVASYVYRANDLFDPDFTGTGHQPMGFDPLMLFYNHFTVLQSKITVVAFNGTAAQRSQISVRVDGASTPLSVVNRILELGGNKYEHLGLAGASSAQKELTLDCDIAKLQGVSRSAITADATLRGDAATSPTEVTYFHIQGWDSFFGSSSMIVDVLIDYVASFEEPRDNVESLQHWHTSKTGVRDSRSLAYLEQKQLQIRKREMNVSGCPFVGGVAQSSMSF